LLDSCGLWVTCGAKWGSKRAKRGVFRTRWARFSGCATWAAEIVGRLGIAFELIDWAAGKGLRGLNDGVSSRAACWVRKCRTIYSVRLWGLIIGKVWRIILRILEAAWLLALRAITGVKTPLFGGWAT